MAVSTSFSKELQRMIITVDDRFDFSLHQPFRDAYSQCKGENINYVLDLSRTKYMDSSALGMILLLKDYVDMHSGNLIISKPNETVEKVLEIAQVHRLMTIEY